MRYLKCCWSDWQGQLDKRGESVVGKLHVNIGNKGSVRKEQRGTPRFLIANGVRVKEKGESDSNLIVPKVCIL
jgi:hypothetical protein